MWLHLKTWIYSLPVYRLQGVDEEDIVPLLSVGSGPHQ